MYKKFSLIIAVLWFASCNPAGNSEEEAFLFSYFKGNGEDGLHLAYSNDGFSFTALNNDQALLTPTVGKDKLMRDPCIIRGKDNKFHMVWTVSWNEKGIGYATSDDLITWSDQKYIPVMEHEPTARNCWAPELFYDASEEEYLIFWSTTIPGLFPETESMADKGWDHRIYYVTTPDFKTFSDTKLFYNHGFNVIDGTLLENEGTFYLFMKDETRYPPQKNIRVATAEISTGPYSEASPSISGNYWAEGPSVTKVGSDWVVYFDKYTEHTMGAILSTDLRNWTDISGKISFPDGTRHGTVCKIPVYILNKLKEHFSDRK